MAVKIKETSYLRFANLLNIDGFEIWELPDMPSILPQDDDIFVTIGAARSGIRETVSTEEDIRPDLLSQRIYGTPDLFWVIALRNNIELMPAQLKRGQMIICPSPRYVFSDVLKRKI